jgi:hypothetical protein
MAILAGQKMKKTKINARLWEKMHSMGFNTAQIAAIGLSNQLSLWITRLGCGPILDAFKRSEAEQLRFVVHWIAKNSMQSFKIAISKMEHLFHRLKVDFKKSQPKITLKLICYLDTFGHGEYFPMCQADIKADFKHIIDEEMHYDLDSYPFNLCIQSAHDSEEYLKTRLCWQSIKPPVCWKSKDTEMAMKTPESFNELLDNNPRHLSKFFLIAPLIILILAICNT